MEKVLKVRGLNKSYGDKQVLHDLNFEVGRGEIFGEKIGGDSTD